jgi:hypothetical protein
MISQVSIGTGNHQKLESMLLTLKEEWSGVVAHPDMEMGCPFYVLNKQVERAILECGFPLSEHQADTKATLGNEQYALELFYCNPLIMVVIVYMFSETVFSDGETDTEMRLKDIRMVKL